MVYLSKIYTKTGDDGTTALGDGSRVAKSALRIESYGTVDELGATVAIAACELEPSELLDSLRRVQNDLFDLGADLCTPLVEGEEGKLRILPKQVERLEREIDSFNEDLEPLKSFILPGGSLTGARLHLARCVCRRAERLVCGLADEELVNPAALHYLNRLSDYLFVLARKVDLASGGEILWEPGREQR